MAKWRCIQSGNVIDLPESEDEAMSAHPDYEKVKAETPAKKEKKKKVK